MDDLIIHPDVLVMLDQTLIKDAIAKMIEAKSSAVLLCNQDGEIDGIVTERDIVRKFTLLDTEDKLERPVNTLMSRPVLFASADDLRDDVIKLYLKHKLRHFPILSGSVPIVENLVGIMSVSDLLTTLLRDRDNESRQGSENASPEIALVFVGAPALVKPYMKIFEELHFRVHFEEDFLAYAKRNKRYPLVIDLDSYQPNRLQALVPAIRKYQGPTLMFSKNPSLVSLLSAYPGHDRQKIFVKPVDISYCSWLLTDSWMNKAP